MSNINLHPLPRTDAIIEDGMLGVNTIGIAVEGP
jgi:hypothetical protein